MRSAAGAAMLGAAALVGALPSPAPAAVNGTHVIAPLYLTSGLELSGYSASTALNVTASRNGVPLGTATLTTDAAGNAAVNGGTADCWTGTTPAILPGDTITVTGDGPDDSMVVQNITAGRPQLDAATGDIVVHGTAADLATGGQVPIALVDSRIVASSVFDANGKRQLRASNDGTIAYDAAGSTSWTATFSGLDAADRSRALGAIDSRGVETPVVSEVTISQSPAAPGPQAPCTAPLASNGVTGTDHMYSGAATVNQANVVTDVVLTGVAQPDATAVNVQIGDGAGGTTSLVPATLTTGPTGGQAWTATIPAAEVAALADGTLTAAATITTPGGDIPGTLLSIRKDTVAPGDPTATPAPGTYQTTQAVTLTTSGGGTVHYTVDGSDPAEFSTAFAGQISITSSQTVRAIAIDPAGNLTAIKDFAYTIAPPVITPPASPAGGGGPTGGGGATTAGGGGGTTTAGGGTTAGASAGTTAGDTGAAASASSARPRLALKALGVARRLKQSKARKSGLRLVMRLPAGTQVVKINVYRKTSTGLKLLSSGFKAPSAAGLYRVAQNHAGLRRLLTKGSYEVQVTPGYSRSELGKTSKAAFKVV